MENLTEVGVSRVNYSSDREEDDNPIGGEIAIDSAEDLAKIGTSSEYPLDGKYILTDDIDLSGTNWTPIGSYTSNTNKSPFTGSFDGNSYKITGLTINRPTTDYVGLFGYTEGAIIESVVLEGVNIRGKENVGGLVGWARNSTEISNYYVTGSVSGSGRFVGGLAGYSSSSTISNSYVTGSVSGGSHYVGGLVGYAINEAKIRNSYATGSVEGRSSVGGLVGRDYDSTITVTSSYWDRQTTSQSTSAGGGAGKSTSEMKLKTTYSGWNFTSIWEITPGNYPTLR